MSEWMTLNNYTEKLMSSSDSRWKHYDRKGILSERVPLHGQGSFCSGTQAQWMDITETMK